MPGMYLFIAMIIVITFAFLATQPACYHEEVPIKLHIRLREHTRFIALTAASSRFRYL
jgi:hypothetical protein